MSFLAPLYIAGASAVVLPLLFHLLRRAPQGRVPFSTLMFVSASPPRFTRRSRLDHLLLLLLRVTALVLLALAFARPLVRQYLDLHVDDASGRLVGVLVDASASMRREQLWAEAVATVQRLADGLDPHDTAALYVFDETVRPLVTFDAWRQTEPARRAAVFRGALAGAEPSWQATNLGEALVRVAEDLGEIARQDTDGQNVVRQLVLFSDLQQGSRLEALQTYPWPEGVLLDVQAVRAQQPTNAGLWSAAAVEEDTAGLRAGGPQVQRVRVTNAPLAAQESFLLTWHDQRGRPLPRPTDVYVPPGESRVVAVPLPEAGPTPRLVLSGDDHAFDNTLHLAPLVQTEATITFVGRDAADDPDQLRYYLERAFSETPRLKVTIVAQAPDEPWPAEQRGRVALAILGDAPSDEHSPFWHTYLAEGGTVLLVVRQADAGGALGALAGSDGVVMAESVPGQYALLGQVDFGDPLLAPFADPGYGDFTKIRFWRYRRARLAESDGPSRPHVLARFDDGSPALWRQPVGRGTLLVLASGWHPADSQLALSSKFVPLMHRMLEQAGVTAARQRGYDVGEAIPVTEAAPRNGPRRVRLPDGNELTLAADARTFTAEQPGLYEFVIGSQRQTVAVNLAADEGRTTPLAVEELENRGVALGRQPTRAEQSQRQRQMQLTELEGRQKLWRWLIVVVLVVLVCETWLAGRLARRSAQPLSTVT